MVKIRSYELEHWVLFDTLNNDQVGRLKNIIDTKTAPAQARGELMAKNDDATSFQSMLDAETAKLENP